MQSQYIGVEAQHKLCRGSAGTCGCTGLLPGLAPPGPGAAGFTGGTADGEMEVTSGEMLVTSAFEIDVTGAEPADGRGGVSAPEPAFRGG